MADGIIYTIDPSCCHLGSAGERHMCVPALQNVLCTSVYAMNPPYICPQYCRPRKPGVSGFPTCPGPHSSVRLIDVFYVFHVFHVCQIVLWPPLSQYPMSSGDLESVKCQFSKDGLAPIAVPHASQSQNSAVFGACRSAASLFLQGCVQSFRLFCLSVLIWARLISTSPGTCTCPLLKTCHFPASHFAASCCSRILIPPSNIVTQQHCHLLTQSPIAVLPHPTFNSLPKNHFFHQHDWT